MWCDGFVDVQFIYSEEIRSVQCIQVLFSFLLNRTDFLHSSSASVFENMMAWRQIVLALLHAADTTAIHGCQASSQAGLTEGPKMQRIPKERRLIKPPNKVVKPHKGLIRPLRAL